MIFALLSPNSHRIFQKKTPLSESDIVWNTSLHLFILVVDCYADDDDPVSFFIWIGESTVDNWNQCKHECAVANLRIEDMYQLSESEISVLRNQIVINQRINWDWVPGYIYTHPRSLMDISEYAGPLHSTHTFYMLLIQNKKVTYVPLGEITPGEINSFVAITEETMNAECIGIVALPTKISLFEKMRYKAIASKASLTRIS